MAKAPNAKSLANLKPWKPGQSGNPAGTAPGRATLQSDFWSELAQDFRENGKQAIVDARTADPVAYIKTVASLMPKEIDIRHAVDGLSDDELDAAIAHFRSVAHRGRAGKAEADTESAAQAPGVPTVQ